MAVLNSTSLDAVQLDPSSPANINYVKARMAIDTTMKNRAAKRAAKMAVISHLHGIIVRQTATPNFVRFEDGTKARF